MTQAYFLIPGLILPKAAESLIGRESLAAATQLTEGAQDEVLRQTFADSVLRDAIHLKWSWAVLTRKPKFPAAAAFSWLMDQGPMLATEVWNLNFAHKNENGSLTVPGKLDIATVEKIASRMTRPLANEGFVLQRWDDTLYLTRKKDWGVSTVPFDVLLAKGVPAAGNLIDPLTPEHAECVAEARNAIERLQTALCQDETIVCDGVTLDFIWISGGGHQQLFFPPTLIRSVLSDNPSIIGWAQNAGILNHRTGKITGATVWPEDAPNGECIAVIDDLYGPWLAGDWQTWQERFPAVCEKIRVLKEASLKKGCDAALIVGCTRNGTVSIKVKSAKPKGLLARLAGKKTFDAATWLFDETKGDAA